MSRLRPALYVFVFLVIALAALPPAYLAANTRSAPAWEVAAELLRQDGGPLAIYRDQQTGIPNFIAGPLPPVKANVRTPLEAARAFLAENARLFRMSDPATELSLLRDERDRFGMNHVRFQQRYNGVEVFGAQLIVHTRGTRVVAVSGTYFPDLAVDTRPALTLEQAIARAHTEVGAADATVAQARSGLAIYAKDRRNRLTWKVEVYAPSVPGRWLVFVNAQSGRIEHRIDMLHTARDRRTYTAGNGRSLPGTLLCDETNASGCDSDLVAKAAHDNAGKVYDYYNTIFGRDSINGAGMPLISTVHFDVDYNNAFWNGEQMVYGDGDGEIFSPLSQSMDVVAHELTHGVTEFTAGLVYEDESGALNESYSDVMGVFADAFARNTTAVNWQLGEEVYTPSIAGDALRDMADPHKGSDPFTGAYNCSYRVAQPLFCGQPASVSEYARLPISLDVPSDQGGVHINSGIPNKAAYLLVDGGTFNSITINGIGVKKAEQIYYRTLTSYLTPYANFLTARNASIQACTDLIGQFGITADDCASVRAAFAAVGIGSNTTLTDRVFLPVALRSALTGPPAVYGEVTLNGLPAAGVQVSLYLCDQRFVRPCNPFKITLTNAAGIYSFPANEIPSTTNDTWYRVVYLNSSTAPDGRLLMWISDDLLTYEQGDPHRFDTFDIADVALGAPNSTTPQSFPVTFTWNARSVGTDYYIWQGYNATFDLIAIENPGLLHSTASFMLNGPSDPQLDPQSNLAQVRFWDVLVISPAGYGITLSTNRVTFAGVAANQTDVLVAKRTLAERLASQAQPTLDLSR